MFLRFGQNKIKLNLKIKNGVYLLFLILPFMQIAPVNLRLVEWIYIFIIFIIFSFWMIKKILKGNFFVPRSIITFSILILFFICFLNFLIALKNGNSLILWLRSFLPLVNLLIFFIVFDEFKKEDIDKLVIVFLISALLFSLKTIYFFLKIGEAKRISLVIESATVSYPVWGLLICFIFLLFERRLYKKIGLVFLSTIFAFSIFIPYIRSMIVTAIISFILLLLVYLFRKPNIRIIKFFRKNAILFIILSALIIFLATKTNLINILLSRFQGINITEPNVSVRVEEWKIALKYFKENPFLGTGFGRQYKIFYNIGSTKNQIFEIVQPTYFHNFIAYFLMYTGIVGTLTYFLFIFSFIFEFIKIFFKKITPKDEVLLLSLLAIFLVSVIYSLAFAEFKTIPYNLLMGVIFASLFKFKNKQKFITTNNLCVG